MNKVTLDKVMDKGMSRAEFLKLAGIASLSVIGFYSLLKSAKQAVNTALPETAEQTNKHKKTTGYGSSSYGS